MEIPTYEVMGDDEHDRLAGLYGPLTEQVRELIDATIRTEADQDAIDAARAAIKAATDALRSRQRDETKVVRYSVGNRPIVWSNAVVGVRNPIAPPLVIHHNDDNTQCWSEFTLAGARTSAQHRRRRGRLGEERGRRRVPGQLPAGDSARKSRRAQDLRRISQPRPRYAE